MNIVARLADLERLLAEVDTDLHEQRETGDSRRPASEGERLVDDLDYAQMLKAASYIRPSRHAGR